ncbi:DUF1752-domain-containing protein [Hypoxylon sp. FL1857]|nr:DUF1752-domain-containing protein [Hypoxylon sp. FL1857]
MPCKAEGLVLTVDPNVIHKVDTNNPQNLFSMWTVFSRCADSVEQGRRLENLSWRLWNRETFCCESKGLSSVNATLPKDIPEQQRIPEVPQLSGSVDSVADEEAIDFTTISDPVEILRPRIVRQDSCASSRSRGRERHITSDHLEKMVVSIIQEKEPNLAPLSDMSSPSVGSSDGDHTQSSPEAEQTPATPITESACESEDASSQSQSQSKSTEAPATTVIRGFSPSQIPTCRVSHERKSVAQDPIPEPSSSPAPKPVQLKKQPAKFKIGDSSSNESSPQSIETRKPVPPTTKRPMFEVGVGSSGEDESPSLKSAMHSARQGPLLNAQKKQTSFNNQITTRTIQTPSDQSDSYMDESAIDDDEDDSEWEDSIEESGKSSVDDAVTFKRVPSKPNLTSQRSLISLMFAGQEERAKGLSNYASHSTPAIPQRARALQNPSNMNVVSSPNDSDNGLEMRRGLRSTPLKPITEVPRSGAQPIMANPQTHYHQAALSPRTTRRNMLATELTESLRRQLLWERQQKTSTANAVLKRRHTSLDVANLKQYPEKAYMAKGKDEPNSSSWNQYFSREDFGGYHAQGW